MATRSSSSKASSGTRRLQGREQKRFTISNSLYAGITMSFLIPISFQNGEWGIILEWGMGNHIGMGNGNHIGTGNDIGKGNGE